MKSVMKFIGYLIFFFCIQSFLKNQAIADVINVTNTNDTGDGSLRQAIIEANNNVGPDTVVFNIPNTDAGFNGNVWTIRPNSALPALIDITGGTVINGSTQTINIGDTNPDGPEIEISGIQITGFDAHGFSINSSNNIIKGFIINGIMGTSSHGINISGENAKNNVIIGNYIGTDITGKMSVANSNNGIRISGKATNNTIGGINEINRNLISGNGDNGIEIWGLGWDEGTSNNQIIGNFIGTDITGKEPLSNSSSGIFIMDSDSNSIEENLISGNGMEGIYIRIGKRNTIIGNLIGTDVDGEVAIPNSNNGIWVADGNSNQIGGKTSEKRNLISGNIEDGIYLGSYGIRVSNVISGNYIGTNISGMKALPNTGNGVQIDGEARFNTIGGDSLGEGNLISGNNKNGILIWGGANVSTNNTISGNYVGTNSSGTAAIPNNENGILLKMQAQNTLVGGDTPWERNIISGNKKQGVEIFQSGTRNNIVIGNFIGTDITGTLAIANRENGVSVWGLADLNRIGGSVTEERNLISGNGLHGVFIESSQNKVIGNYIGCDVTGSLALPNNGDGVHIQFGAKLNTIGGENPSEANIISCNNGHGVMIMHNETWNNVIIGNFIGTNKSTLVDMGNKLDGVHIEKFARGNIIGPSNYIAFNGDDGVEIKDVVTYENTITQNSITNNIGKGIRLTNGANRGISAPRILNVSNVDTLYSISGIAVPNSTIEIFSDTEDEGKFYEGNITSQADSNFVWIGKLRGEYVTATVTDIDGNTSEFALPFKIITNVNDIQDNVVPIFYNLSQNYPNPFNPETIIEYQLPKKSNVSLIIYNITGQKVKSLVTEEQQAGYYITHWNGINEKGNHVAGGLYFYRLKTENFVKVKKMILIR